KSAPAAIRWLPPILRMIPVSDGGMEKDQTPEGCRLQDAKCTQRHSSQRQSGRCGRPKARL
ncbi:MAG: hypothetical protein AAB947_01300, partial [Patescibacteria group bacterium]